MASPQAFRRDGPVLVAATLLCTAALVWGEFGRWVGAGSVAILLAYIVLTYVLERDGGDPACCSRLAASCSWWSGPAWLVEAAIDLAARFGVSETLIGLTIVAVGTSLPELTAALAAAWRGQSDLAFGNVVGSNLYNILGILGVTALVRPIPVPSEIVAFDAWVMLAATGLLVLMTVTGWRITRREAGTLVALYAGYLGWLVATA
jgi:cation:H+ antiporter